MCCQWSAAFKKETLPSSGGRGVYAYEYSPLMNAIHRCGAFDSRPAPVLSDVIMVGHRPWAKHPNPQQRGANITGLFNITGMFTEEGGGLRVHPGARVCLWSSHLSCSSVNFGIFDHLLFLTAAFAPAQDFIMHEVITKLWTAWQAKSGQQRNLSGTFRKNFKGLQGAVPCFLEMDLLPFDEVDENLSLWTVVCYHCWSSLGVVMLLFVSLRWVFGVFLISFHNKFNVIYFFLYTFRQLVCMNDKQTNPHSKIRPDLLSHTSSTFVLSSSWLSGIVSLHAFVLLILGAAVSAVQSCDTFDVVALCISIHFYP